jgi:hypothetical protein
MKEIENNCAEWLRNTLLRQPCSAKTAKARYYGWA